MMHAIQFMKEFITQPRNIGAVMPSSRQLAKQMTDTISYATATCIVEYGPGTGVFTEAILSRKRATTKLLLIEQNEEFCCLLREKYAHIPNVHIVCDSAEQVDIHMKAIGCSQSDYIISGLPFTSLSPAVSQQILYKTSRMLDSEGTFITFQYSKAKQTWFKSYFQRVEAKRVYWNVPPAYVFTCAKPLLMNSIHLAHTNQS